VLSFEESILDSLTATDVSAEVAGFIEDPEKYEKKPQVNRIARNNNLLLGIINDQTRVRFVWQCITACLLIFIVAASFICFSLYTSRQNLAEKLSELKPLEKKLETARAEADSAKTNVITSNAELKHTQSELNIAKAEIKRLQEQLADITQQYEALQARNAEVVKLLNGRLQKLSNQSSQTAPK
ncbi:MAG: hypothetical protein WCE45_01750, partial [Sedimentisphaerales bacterium]